MLNVIKVYNNPVTVDSRGILLVENDIVFIDDKGHNGLYIGKVVNRGGNLFIKTPNSYIYSAFIIKLSGGWDSNLDKFLISLKSDALNYLHKNYELNKSNNIDNFNNISSSEITYSLEEIYKEKNQRNDTRNFPVTDYLGQDLSAMDLCLYTEKNTMKYGILISNTQLFNENYKKLTKHFVLKLSDLTEEEQKLKMSLLSEYKKSSLKVHESNVKYGDVYTDSNYIYIYLGKIDFSYKYIGISNSVINWKPENQEIWFKIETNKNLYNAVLSDNMDYIYSELKSNLLDHVEVIQGYYKVNDNLYTVYKNIKNLGACVYKIPSKSNYIKNIKLKKKIIFEYPVLSLSTHRESYKIFENLKFVFNK